MCEQGGGRERVKCALYKVQLQIMALLNARRRSVEFSFFSVNVPVYEELTRCVDVN